MKNIWTLILIGLLGACNLNTEATKEVKKAERIISASKQYTEIIYALGADDKLVGVDLSSSYPPETSQKPNVGYHMHLSVEGMASLNPDLILHGGGKFSIGPPEAVNQLKKVGIPMHTFDTKAKDIPTTIQLMREMGAFFDKKEEAEKLIQKLESDMNKVQIIQDTIQNRPKVLAIHFGQAMNIYLALDKTSVGGQMIEWAGGEYCLNKGKGMNRITSPEMIARANPDVILLTGFGYDRLGSVEKVKEIPGIALTNAAKNDKIYRVEAHDLIYFGPRTGKNVLKLNEIIFQ
ncbi:MAG: ABC transporter substrate-binding protein [Crocinitomicaceae bacterium]|nr:ABC transporter substrate-binding protein [Crocinitomicaceae bacterium]